MTESTFQDYVEQLGRAVDARGGLYGAGPRIDVPQNPDAVKQALRNLLAKLQAAGVAGPPAEPEQET